MSSEVTPPNHCSRSKPESAIAGGAAPAQSPVTVTLLADEVTAVPPKLATTGISTVTTGEGSAEADAPTEAHPCTVRSEPPLNETLVVSDGVAVADIVASREPNRTAAAA